MRASGRATIEPTARNPRGRPRASRATDEPRVEHPDDHVDEDADEDYDPRDGFYEDAESSHPL